MSIPLFWGMPSGRFRLEAQEYIKGILSSNRTILGRSITLIESSLDSDQELSNTVINGIIHKTGSSIRVGITGVPGVGKSTFIESFGTYLCNQGIKVAVLAIDPSSQKTKGSILGDKTRMENLAHHPNAFIRPSPTGNSLGGVATKTRETMLLCEAAGYEVVLIETVGVGQSEVAVKEMTDFFLLLMLAGAGDELQGIKKGIMEMADGIAITKADGDNIKPAQQARAEYRNALHLFPLDESGWNPEVLTCSAKDKTGIDEIYNMIQRYSDHVKSNGYFNKRRSMQNKNWMHEIIRHQLIEQFFKSSEIQTQLCGLEKDVMNGSISPRSAADRLLKQH